MLTSLGRVSAFSVVSTNPSASEKSAPHLGHSQCSFKPVDVLVAGLPGFLIRSVGLDIVASIGMLCPMQKSLFHLRSWQKSRISTQL